MQSKVGKAFVHEAYRYQALPPGSRDEFASSMSARARPRAATTTDKYTAAAAAATAGGVALTRGLMAVEFVDEEGGCSSSDDSEVGGEGDRDIELEGSGSRRAAAGGDSEGVRDIGGVGGGDEDSARAAPALVSAGEISGGETPEWDGGVGNESTSKSTADGSPNRKLWGAGPRMYV